MSAQNLVSGQNKSTQSGQKTIWAIIVVLAIAALAWYFMAGKNKKSETNNNNTESTSQTPTSSNPPPAKEQVSIKHQSLKTLLASGVSQKCDFADGRIYLANGKVRGYFDSLVNGQEQKSNMLNDGEYVYIWTDGQSLGIKMSAETMMNSSSGSVDPNEEYDYTCTERGVGAENFQLPSEVTFTDAGFHEKPQ